MKTILFLKNFLIPSKENGLKPGFLKSNFLLYTALFLLAIKIATPLCFLNFQQSIFFADITKTALINMINQDRELLGVNLLSENKKLDDAAYLKTKDMFENNYFSHVSPTGINPWHWFSVAGYHYQYAGENLAIGFFDSKEVYDAWLNSPSHRENIFNAKYKEVGISVLTGQFQGKNVTVVALLFGSPQAQISSTINKQNEQTTTPKNKDTSEKVLLPEIMGDKILGSANQRDDIYSKIINYAIYNYETLIGFFIYGIIILIIIGFLPMILTNNIPHNRNVALRMVIIFVILFTALLANKEIIYQFIPHQIII